MLGDSNVKLKSSEGEVFEVDESTAYSSQTVRDLIADIGIDSVIPLPNVPSKTLAKVLEYCKYHAECRTSSDDKLEPSILEDKIKQWNAEFVEIDKDFLFEIVVAANCLNINDLLDLTCQAVAHMIQGKSAEAIRKTFNIKNDFTPEEEEEIRRENHWAFE